MFNKDSAEKAVAFDNTEVQLDGFKMRGPSPDQLTSSKVLALPERFYQPARSERVIVIGLDKVGDTQRAIEDLIRLDRTQFGFLEGAVFAKKLFADDFSKAGTQEKTLVSSCVLINADKEVLVFPKLAENFVKHFVLGLDGNKIFLLSTKTFLEDDGNKKLEGFNGLAEKTEALRKSKVDAVNHSVEAEEVEEQLDKTTKENT